MKPPEKSDAPQEESPKEYKKRSLSSREQFQLEEDRRFFGLGKLLRLSRDLFSNLLYRVNYGFGGRHTLPLKERLILRIQAPRIEKLTTTPISFPNSPRYVCIKTIGYGTLHIEPYMENNKELKAFEVSINEVSEHTFALPLHVSFRIYVRNYMGKGCLKKSQLYDFPKREYSIIPFRKNREIQSFQEGKSKSDFAIRFLPTPDIVELESNSDKHKQRLLQLIDTSSVPELGFAKKNIHVEQSAKQSIETLRSFCTNFRKAQQQSKLEIPKITSHHFAPEEKL